MKAIIFENGGKRVGEVTADFEVDVDMRAEDRETFMDLVDAADNHMTVDTDPNDSIPDDAVAPPESVVEADAVDGLRFLESFVPRHLPYQVELDGVDTDDGETPARTPHDELIDAVGMRPHVQKEAAWEPYTGPQGGEGWRNTRTDEVRYQEDPPGPVADDADRSETAINDPDTVEIGGVTIETLDSLEVLTEGDDVLYRKSGENHRAKVVNTTSWALTLEVGSYYPTIEYREDDHGILGRVIEDDPDAGDTETADAEWSLENAFDHAEKVVGAREAGITGGNTTGDEMKICEMPDGSRVFATPVNAYANVTGQGLTIDPDEARTNNLYAPNVLEHFDAKACQTAIAESPDGTEYITKEGIEGPTLKEFKQDHKARDLSPDELDQFRESLVRAGAAAFFVGNADIHTGNIVVDEDTSEAVIIDHDSGQRNSRDNITPPAPISTRKWPIARAHIEEEVKDMTVRYMQGDLEAPPEDDAGPMYDYFFEAVEHIQRNYDEVFDDYETPPDQNLRGYGSMDDFEEGDRVKVVHDQTRQVKEATLSDQYYTGAWYGYTDDNYEIKFSDPKEVLEIEGYDPKEVFEDGISSFSDFKFGDRVTFEVGGEEKEGQVTYVDGEDGRLEIEGDDNRMYPVSDLDQIKDVRIGDDRWT